MNDVRPVKLLIVALGGEGGGVLASWITNAAVAAGHVAQRTSIPGVAQRTGATTYYLEIVPHTANGKKPVLALNPAPGEVDVMLASELLETTRAVQAGSITRARTHLIASTHRVFTVDEMWSRPIRNALLYSSVKLESGLACLSSQTADTWVTVTSSRTPREPITTPASKSPWGLMSLPKALR